MTAMNFGNPCICYIVVFDFVAVDFLYKGRTVIVL